MQWNPIINPDGGVRWKNGGHVIAVGPCALGSTKKTQLLVFPCLDKLSGAEEVFPSIGGVWINVFG